MSLYLVYRHFSEHLYSLNLLDETAFIGILQIANLAIFHLHGESKYVGAIISSKLVVSNVQEMVDLFK